jgi:predicted Zn-dependent protease
MRRSGFWGGAAAIFFLTTVPGYGQFGLGKNKDKDKDAERVQKETERDAKNLRAYEKIKSYAIDKYASDPDFHDEVDSRYADVLRDHTAIAFEKNTHRGSKIYAVNEDRFRLNDETNGIYDNLLVQDRINRIGQSLVPKDSEKTFAFRLTANPTPGADTLATGTIYITTGMVSLLDNEAQLAYVLAHEMAHVQLDHWRQKAMMEVGAETYNNDQTRKAERIGVIAGIAGGLTGGLATKSLAAGIGSAVGAGGLGLLAGELLNRKVVVNWDRAQEDEADKMAFKAMLNAQYDVREVPKLYTLVENVVVKDTRATLGFLGEKNRVKERKEAANKLIADAYKADIEAQLKGAGFHGDSAGHRNLMAELKRDNGIMAYYSDMLELARKNLEEAVAIRDNDPAAQYYYGKTLETIGRTPEEQKMAQQAFVKAAQFDRYQENFGSHLHQALMLLEDENSQNNAQLRKELDTYVTDYARYQLEYSKTLLLPPNINTISDYMRLYGAADWQPKLPEGASTVRLTENQLPKNPEAPKPAAQTVTPAPAAPKIPCATPAQCAAAGVKAVINK